MHARSIEGGRRLALVLMMALLGACASLPPPGERPVSHALQASASATTALGATAREAAPNRHGSGIRLLSSGDAALGSLIALADYAQRTLDLQYYLIEDDASSHTVLYHVRRAAARGVRVRLLLDDLKTAGTDESLLCLAEQPNVEVRLYNPLPAGRFSTFTRVLSSLTDLERINRRMHDKMFVADNAIAITGGRNIGDAYFVQSPSVNFVDLDVIAAGPVVPELSASFDRFWNSELAYPIHTLVTSTPDCQGLLAGTPEAGAGVRVPHSVLADSLSDGRLALQWVPVVVLADRPSKIIDEQAPGPGDTVSGDVASLMRQARHEVIVISPYYVPGEQGVALVRELRERGVRVRVLTNSLATTDAPVVHIGYARYRKALLRLGVELYELRGPPGHPRSRFGRFGSSQASLHAKAMVVDRRIVVIGSMNMDPRSATLNTEIGMLIRSHSIATQVASLFEDAAREDSWHVELSADDALRWVSAVLGVAPVEGTEPDTSLGLRLLLKLLAPFAPEELL